MQIRLEWWDRYLPPPWGVLAASIARISESGISLKYLDPVSVWNNVIAFVSNLQKCLFLCKKLKIILLNEHSSSFDNNMRVLSELTTGSRFVKCTIQPSLSTLDPRFFVCFTLCTIRISGILLLGVELQ